MKNTMSTARQLLVAALSVCIIPASYAAAKISYHGVVPGGNPAQVKSIVTQTCAACHGAHGNSLMPQYPNLAGQNQGYLMKQLLDFNNGSRTNQTMQAMVKIIPSKHFARDVKDIAYYFSQQKFNPDINANAKAPKATLKVLKLGEQIYRSGIPSAKVPACMACHEADGMGNGPMAIPRLAGQHSKYVITQLEQFRHGKRSNDPHKMMRMIAGRLNTKEITAVAFYVQALRPKLVLGNNPQNYVQAIKQRKSTPLIGVSEKEIKKPGDQKGKNKNPSKSSGSSNL
ncbi:c-type cytochrome [Acidihalobacter prosperus]